MNPIIARVNPILARELVNRMRGPKAMALRAGYLSLLGLVFILVYHAELGGGADRRFHDGNTVVDWASVGQGMFEWTLMFMMVAVLFLVPGFTAGSIVGERQRQTLMPVQISLMRPSSIVLGKLGASVIFTLLLVVATMPLLTVAHLIGGITFTEIVKGLSMVMFTTLCIASASLLFSAIMKSSRTATVMSYFTVLALCFVVLATMFTIFLLQALTGILNEDAMPSAAGWILWSSLAVNPIAALADVVGSSYEWDWFDSSADGPLSELKSLLYSDGAPPGWQFMPLWMLHFLFYSAVLALSLIRSSRRLRVPAEMPR